MQEQDRRQPVSWQCPLLLQACAEPSRLAHAAGAGLLSTGANAASIAGKVDVYLAGGTAHCEGLRLLPRTAQSERQMQSFFGDLGKACDSIAASVCQGLRDNADADYPEQGAHVETTLAALRTAADGLGEVAEGWI